MSSFTSTLPVSVSEFSAIPTVVSEQESTIEEVGDNSLSFVIPQDEWYQDPIKNATLTSLKTTEQIRIENREYALEQEKKENLAVFIKAQLSESDIFPVVARQALDLSGIEALHDEVLQAFYIGLPDGAEIGIQFIYHCPETIVVEKKPVVVKAPVVSKLPVLVKSKIPVFKTSKLAVLAKKPTVKNVPVPVVASPVPVVKANDIEVSLPVEVEDTEQKIIKASLPVSETIKAVVTAPAPAPVVKAITSSPVKPITPAPVKAVTTASFKAITPALIKAIVSAPLVQVITPAQVVSAPAGRRALGSLSAPPQLKVIKASTTSTKPKTVVKPEPEVSLPKKLPVSLTNRVSLRYQKRVIVHPQLWTEDGWF